MLTSSDIESLIAVKRREIEKEKSHLGLSPPTQGYTPREDKENAQKRSTKKKVKFAESRVLCERNDTKDEEEKNCGEQHKEPEDFIPPDLERYIRRYIGLPVMLKAGEYSPNNPLVRGERAPGDVLLGLGEYERRRNTLRKIRQQQYREYLDQLKRKLPEPVKSSVDPTTSDLSEFLILNDSPRKKKLKQEIEQLRYKEKKNRLKIRRLQMQVKRLKKKQAKKKQEAKEQAERERREREQREREREERERELVEERDKYSPNRRRSVQQLQSSQSVQNLHRDHHMQLVPLSAATTKVDTGVQVDGFSQPLSVAVQTDDSELFSVPSSPLLCQLTTAERELSPRTALVCDTSHHEQPRRRSYGDFDERSCLLKKCSRSRLSSDLRHTYMPSIFDADAIRLRNLQAEKEAAERRQFYQQELKDQILEQQRIREERKNREKMLEQAEMRRLEEQLRMLRMAQERERGRQHDIAVTMKENATEYQNKRSELQREIDLEQQKILRASSQPNRSIQRHTNTSKSDTAPSKLPFYYPKIYEQTNEIQKKPYTINIPDNSIFSSNYDVDSYLRKNLNFNKNKDYFHEKSNVEIKEITPEKKLHVPKNDTYEKNEEKTLEKKIHVLRSDTYGKSEENDVEKKLHVSKNEQSDENTHKNNLHVSTNKNIEEKSNIMVEKALIHEKPDSRPRNLDIPSKNIECIDTLPIPVLRHSPTLKNVSNDNIKMSEAMKKVDDKWKVPAIQKNILKSLPNDEGKNVNILTQLGSIRRQLQLEQLKLDKMLSKDDV